MPINSEGERELKIELEKERKEFNENLTKRNQLFEKYVKNIIIFIFFYKMPELFFSLTHQIPTRPKTYHVVRCGLEPPEIFDYLGMKL